MPIMNRFAEIETCVEVCIYVILRFRFCRCAPSRLRRL